MLSRLSHGGVRPLNLFMIHYLIWDSLERMPSWEGRLLLGSKKDLGGIFHCSYLTLSEHICLVVMLIEFTCQDILLIKWIMLHKVLCTGVGSQGKLLMYTT